MKTRKSTKRALLLSVCSIMLCLVMLIGTTFAWFTDTASTAVNTITSGTLKIDIVDANGESIKGKSMSFVNKEGSADILWEPGVTFRTPVFKIKNAGTLALKYKMALNGIVGDSKLLKVITFSVVNSDGEAVELDKFEGYLTPDEVTSEALYIEGHMAESAGNEYQKQTLEGLGISVAATQYTYEFDSTTDQYDKDATYPVQDEAELKAAFAAAKDGDVIVLADDTELTNTGTYGTGTPDTYIIAKNVTLDLNGKTLTVNTNDRFMLAADGITLKNGKIAAGPATGTNTGKITYSLGITSSAKNVLIEDVEIEGGVEVLGSGTNSTFKNVKITATNYYDLYLAFGAEATFEGGELNANASGTHVYMESYSFYSPCQLTIKGATISGGTIKCIYNNDDAGTVTVE